MLSWKLISSTATRGTFGSVLHSKGYTCGKNLVQYNPILKRIIRTKGYDAQQIRDQAQREMQSFWEKNITRRSPWSPHLGAYSPPAVMQFSFLHRATGIAMAIVWASLGCSAFFFTGHYEAMLEYVRNMALGSAIITGSKFVLCYPIVYHYFNGMRHLAWDYAIGFPIKTCNATGMTVVAISLAVAAVLAVVKL